MTRMATACWTSAGSTGHVLPAESYAWAGRRGIAPREIARLQQRARALETEIERRQELEAPVQALASGARGAALGASGSRRRGRTPRRPAGSKDDFLAVLSHELRTPLNAILRLDANRRRAAGAQATAVSRALEVIGRNAVQQMRLIDDLLDVSRIVSGKMRIAADPVDLSATLAAARRNCRPGGRDQGRRDRRRRRRHGAPRDGRRRPAAAGDLEPVVQRRRIHAERRTRRVRLERVNADAQLVVQRHRSGHRAPRSCRTCSIRFRQSRYEHHAAARRAQGWALAVVRYLVEAHGRHVTANERGEGSGATCTVRLPLRTVSSSETGGRFL